MSLKTYVKLLGKTIKKVLADTPNIVLIAIVAMLMHLMFFVEMSKGAKFELVFSMILALLVVKKLNDK